MSTVGVGVRCAIHGLCVIWGLALSSAHSAESLVRFSNSVGVTEVLRMNDAGYVIGQREAAVAGGLAMESFLRRGEQDLEVGSVPDFSNVELTGISGQDVIVGRASRAPGQGRGNQRAIVRQVADATWTILTPPDSYLDSVAFDISADGRVISGVAIGRDPARIVPCVWQRQEAGWSCQILPTPFLDNLLLVTARVAISDDGRTVAASVVAAEAAGQRYYGLYRWTRPQADAPWQRQQIGDRAVHLGDVNDSGMVAGRVLLDNRRRACVYLPDRAEPIWILPEGKAHSVAMSVNNRGQVVGVAEDPPGPEGTTVAFLWHAGSLVELPPLKGAASSTANSITATGRIGGMLERIGEDGAPSVEAYLYAPQ